MSEISFEQVALSDSASVRQRGFEAMTALTGSSQCRAAFVLLSSPFRDLVESVLSFCTSEVLSRPEWKEAIRRACAGSLTEQSAHLLVLLQHLDEPLEAAFVTFYRRCLDAPFVEVRYQAFCLAEMQCENTPSYVEKVRSWLCCEDEDFRIVSIQAISRLLPDWGVSALESRIDSASRIERFHLILTLFRLSDGKKYEDELLYFLNDDRFSFAVIDSLGQFGSVKSVPELLKLAGNFLTEPTIRVAAAGAAARLGDAKGRKWLEKFSRQRHGNPSYARELLAMLDVCDGLQNHV